MNEVYTYETVKTINEHYKNLNIKVWLQFTQKIEILKKKKKNPENYQDKNGGRRLKKRERHD